VKASLSFIDPKEDPLYASEKDLRFRVLREPLGMGRHQVTFAGELEGLHLVALAGDVVMGCVLFDFPSGRLRAMAIDASRQRTGLGRELVERLEEELRAKHGVQEVRLHARETAVPFYERLGYSLVGEPFIEVVLPHRAMVKRI